MVVVPKNYIGRHATYIGLMACIVRRMRERRAQSQANLSRAVGLSRYQFGARERNATNVKLGWTMGQLIVLDKAWMLPTGTLISKFLEALEQLKTSLSFLVPSVAVRPLTVDQLDQLLDYAEALAPR